MTSHDAKILDQIVKAMVDERYAGLSRQARETKLQLLENNGEGRLIYRQAQAILELAKGLSCYQDCKGCGARLAHHCAHCERA